MFITKKKIVFLVKKSLQPTKTPYLHILWFVPDSWKAELCHCVFCQSSVTMEVATKTWNSSTMQTPQYFLVTYSLIMFIVIIGLL